MTFASNKPSGGTILVVDDTPQNLLILTELLRPNFHVRAVNSGERALRAAHSEPRPDLILLDVMMPEMDGREVLKRLRSDPQTQNLPVIFITAMAAVEDEQMGLELGAVDYITKPFNPAIVLARVNTQLELKRARDRLAQENQWLDAEVDRRMKENLLVQDLNIRALACLAEARDNETGLHILRTQSYVRILARHLQGHLDFKNALAGQGIDRIIKAAPLHDIGKVGIPDAILLKPGKLTAEEFHIMKRHPVIGFDAITKAITQSLEGASTEVARYSESAFAFLRVAGEIALCHHEKWDGSGYPKGLAGDAIPVSARLMALADVFDALMCKRVYKAAKSSEESSRIIIEGRGRHFDPRVVDAYLECRQEFEEIARLHAEPE